LLNARSLSRSFGRLKAVDDVSLSIAQGGITGLIGPNGAGKTTLFNLLAGSLQPDSGEILFQNRPIQMKTPDWRFRHGIARTFQIARPFPNMSVLENVLLAAPAQTGEAFWNGWFRQGRIGVEERKNQDRAHEILEFTTLGRLAHEPASSLSGGQRKLLELARILMTDPKLILLDEPAAGVNPALVETLCEKIIALNARGITFLLIEHNMDLIMRLCRPIHVMAQGKMIFEGDGAAVRSDPRVIDAYLGDVM
jgi:branched-chain amino acid transport system ATP-binding protein